MPDFVAILVFIISIIIAFFFTVLIGRKVFRTGVEHLSSRMLILTGVINVFLCILLLLFQTIAETANTSALTSGSLFFLPVILLIPAKILWNYFSIQKKLITQFNLKPHNNKAVADTILSLAKTMDITEPVVLSSGSVKMPFVFGRRSQKAFLAIPEKWDTLNEPCRYSVLLHELAHIRNHDVGFLAWSTACLKDLRWLLIFFPFLIILRMLFQYGPLVSSLSVFLSCLIVLYALLKYILRKRELFADMTAALLIESGSIEQAISIQSTDILNNLGQVQHSRSTYRDAVYRWLTDKALFSKYPKRWTVALQILTFFRVSHPERSKRIDNTSSINKKIASPQVTLGNSFWAGVTLGFLGVTIGLCGYWLSGPIQYDPEDTDCLLLSYTLYGLAAPLAVGFWVIFITLPFWASLSNPNLDKMFFRSLLKRHGIAFAGACIISLLILTVSMTQLHLKILFVLCILWQLLITLMGFCVSIVSVFMWNIARYLQASSVNNLRKSLWTLIPLLIVALGATFLGMFWISNHKVFEGASLIFSTLVGNIIFKNTIGQSRFSEPDHYMTMSFLFFNYQIEGKKFLRQYKLIDMTAIPLLLLFLISFCYASVFILFRNMFDNLSIRSAIISLIIIGCIILVLIQLSERGKFRMARRPKIYRLFHCLKLLSKVQNTGIRRKISQFVKSYDLTDRRFAHRTLHLTTGDVHEIHCLVEDNSPKLRKQSVEWALQCQQPDGGLGLWPQSGPRLISTYQALSIFKDSNRLDAVNSSEHVSWIKSLQQQDGSFKGSWSKRKAWEDTFFAVKSLNFLGASLETNRAEQCRQWSRRVLQDGITEDQPDMIYYSTGALDALGRLDKDITHATSDWLCHKIEKLLLTNIGLNYEAIHFTVMTYNIVNQSTPLPSMAPQIQLLTNRIQTALDAELEDIRD